MVISGTDLAIAPEQTSLPNDSVMVWQNAATEKPQIPSGFNLEIITNYLKDFSSTLSFEDEDGDEIINSGTQKPVVNGRNMYRSCKWLNLVQILEMNLSFELSAMQALKEKRFATLE